MSFLKLWKKGDKKRPKVKLTSEDIEDDEEQRQRAEEEEIRDTSRRAPNEEEARSTDGTKFVYFACQTPRDDILDLLQSLNKDSKVSSVFEFI
jgi:hypothetical protein